MVIIRGIRVTISSKYVFRMLYRFCFHSEYPLSIHIYRCEFLLSRGSPTAMGAPSVFMLFLLCCILLPHVATVPTSKMKPSLRVPPPAEEVYPINDPRQPAREPRDTRGPPSPDEWEALAREHGLGHFASFIEINKDELYPTPPKLEDLPMAKEGASDPEYLRLRELYKAEQEQQAKLNEIEGSAGPPGNHTTASMNMSFTLPEGDHDSDHPQTEILPQPFPDGEWDYASDMPKDAAKAAEQALKQQGMDPNMLKQLEEEHESSPMAAMDEEDGDAGDDVQVEEDHGENHPAGGGQPQLQQEEEHDLMLDDHHGETIPDGEEGPPTSFLQTQAYADSELDEVDGDEEWEDDAEATRQGMLELDTALAQAGNSIPDSSELLEMSATSGTAVRLRHGQKWGWNWLKTFLSWFLPKPKPLRRAAGVSNYGNVDCFWSNRKKYLHVESRWGEGVCAMKHSRFGLPDKKSLRGKIISFTVWYYRGTWGWVGRHGGLAVGRTRKGRKGPVDFVVDWLDGARSHRVYWTQHGVNHALAFHVHAEVTELSNSLLPPNPCKCKHHSTDKCNENH